MAERKKRTVSDSHKQAMAQGRSQSRVVSTYLEALESHRPKRGRKRTPASIDRRLGAIETALEAASPIRRLSLVQERLDLERERAAMGASVDLSSYEQGFVEVAAEYGSRKGITYTAWRSLGVPAPVLAKAGISRTAG